MLAYSLSFLSCVALCVRLCFTVFLARYMLSPFHPQNSSGFPQTGASNKGVVGKTSHFLALNVNIRYGQSYINH